jgi:hypothetical protein
MGLESDCTLCEGKRRTGGRALLETEYLLFRGGGTRVRIPFSDILGVESHDGALVVAHAHGEAVLELGPAAAKWAEKIRNPRSLLDKLGVKPGMRVAVIGVDDPDFLAQLKARVGDVGSGRSPARRQIVFFGTETRGGLARLRRLRGTIEPNGAIWVVHRKGKGATLKDVDVFAAARAAGLVDNKVASFSPTHTAERLVIPLAKRHPSSSRQG